MTDNAALFARIARSVAAKNRGVAEAEDIEQELWLWWLDHDQPDLTEPDWATTRTLYTVAERYARKEREARIIGPRDTRYNADEVLVLVELLVNPPSDTKSEVLGGELAEVMSALLELPQELRGLLAAHAAGESYRSIADRTGMSLSTTHRKVQNALYDVVHSLNGADAR